MPCLSCLPMTFASRSSHQQKLETSRNAKLSCSSLSQRTASTASALGSMCEQLELPALLTSTSGITKSTTSISSLPWEPSCEPLSYSSALSSTSCASSTSGDESSKFTSGGDDYSMLFDSDAFLGNDPYQSDVQLLIARGQSGNPYHSDVQQLTARCQSSNQAPPPTDSFLHPLPSLTAGKFEIEHTFSKFCGCLEKMDTVKFQKVCKDCSLLDKKFKPADADIIFMQVKKANSKSNSGAYKLDLAGFETALRLVAKKKDVDEDVILQAVAESHGPSMNFTKAEAVRFHDDKSLYTGTHARGGPDVGRKGKGSISQRETTDLSTGAFADPIPSFVDDLSRRMLVDPAPCRRRSQTKIVTATSTSRVPSNGEEGFAGSVEDTFNAYSKNEGRMDGKSFMKLCRDCNLIGDGLYEADADLIFAKFKARHLRHMDMARFKRALQFVALQKGEATDAVYNAVAGSSGPVLTGTLAGKVRFHNHKRSKSTVDVDDEQNWRLSLRPCGGTARLPKFVAQRVGELPEVSAELNSRAIAEFQRERSHLRDSVKTRPPAENLSDDVTMVFTDVQGSTSLWEANPYAMEQALRIHDATMRRNMAKHNGYEVTTEGDAFQIVFHDAIDAVGFCLDVQTELYSCDQWPQAILQHPDAQVADGAWRGLRVRMGMSSGRPRPPTKHEVTGRLRYAGRCVAIAKAVEELCHGGQILLSSSSFSQINGLLTQLQSPQVVDLGEHLLHVHGLAGSMNQADEKVRLLQLVPAALSHDYFSCSSCSRSDGANCSGGRIFPQVTSKMQISSGFDAAPAGPLITLCFVFAKGARDLVASNSDLATHALGMIRNCVRNLLGEPDTAGYECQEDEGAFMLAFASQGNAAAFASTVQQQLPELPWQKELCACSSVFANGMRVSIGALEGGYTSRGPHASTGRADYFGTMVNRTARIAQAAHAGQVLFGQEFSDMANGTALSLPCPPGTEVMRLGAYAFKGVDGPLVVHELRVLGRDGKFEVFPEPKAKGKVGD